MCHWSWLPPQHDPEDPVRREGHDPFAASQLQTQGEACEASRTSLLLFAGWSRSGLGSPVTQPFSAGTGAPRRCTGRCNVVCSGRWRKVVDWGAIGRSPEQPADGLHVRLQLQWGCTDSIRAPRIYRAEDRRPKFAPGRGQASGVSLLADRRLQGGESVAVNVANGSILLKNPMAICVC